MNYQTDNNYKKYFNFEEEGILLSMTKVKNYQDFEKKKNTTGGVNFNWFIPVEKLKEFSINEKSRNTVITYISNKGNEKTIKFAFTHADEGMSAANGLASMYGLQPAKKEENKLMALLISLFPIALTLLFVWLVYGMAVEIEELGYYPEDEGTDNRERLFAKVAEGLGTMGTLALGGVSTLFFGYRAYTRFTKPATVHIWKPAKEI